MNSLQKENKTKINANGITETNKQTRDVFFSHRRDIASLNILKIPFSNGRYCCRYYMY